MPLHHILVDVGSPAGLGRHDQVAVLYTRRLGDGNRATKPCFFYPRPDNGFGSPAGTFTKPVFRIMVDPTTTTQSLLEYLIINHFAANDSLECLNHATHKAGRLNFRVEGLL
jgi:hypothetical protein